MTPHDIQSYLDTLSADSPLTISSLALSPATTSDCWHPSTIRQRRREEISDDQPLTTDLIHAEFITDLEIHEEMIKRALSEIHSHPERRNMISRHILRLKSMIYKTVDTEEPKSPDIPLEQTSDGSTSFITARSHLTLASVLSTNGQEPQAAAEDRAYEQEAIEAQMPRSWPSREFDDDWRKLPRIMRSSYTVSGIQKCLKGCAPACAKDRSMTARLFFAIASPYAMAQLQEIFGVMRRNDKLLPFVKPHTIYTALQFLDKRESSQLMSRFGTRFYFVALHSLYTKRRNELQKYNPQVSDSESLKTIVAEIYPDLERGSLAFQKVTCDLQNKLCLARNWGRMANRYGLDIICFIPWGGEFEIYDKIVQRLPENHFDDFLNLLDEKRGYFLRQCTRMIRPRFRSLLKSRPSTPLQLEVTDSEVIKRKKFDSQNLLNILRPCDGSAE